MELNQNFTNRKRLYRGTVVSDSMEKTVVALVETTLRHKHFGKILRRTKKYKIHDEQGVAKVGDVIEFFSGRPISKTKHMYLHRIISENSTL